MDLTRLIPNLGTSVRTATPKQHASYRGGSQVQRSPLLLRFHTVSERMPAKNAIPSLRCQASTFAGRLHRHHAIAFIRAPDTAPRSISTSHCAGPCSRGLISRGSGCRCWDRSFQPILPQNKFAQIATMSSEAMPACHGHNEACCNIPAVVASGYTAKGSYEELGGLKTCKISHLTQN